MSEVTLRALADEIGHSKEYRTQVEFLLKIHRKIYENRDCQKFQCLNKSNAKLGELLQYSNGFLFLKESGWEEENEKLNYINQANLPITIELLQKYRIIAPSPSEWTESNKMESLSKKDEREDELKREAIKQRDKEYNECLKDMKERKELAASIMAEHHKDIELRKKKKEDAILAETKEIL